ncbi:MAG: sigma-E processing peptidase SpoIIGA [Ruminococcus sp.]|nr:sigma-E processing peptidase SpoIIGA [Ruminococcus sp.]
MQTIYIDVLIVLNIYVNFFLIRTSSKITHTPVKFSRCIIASSYGSIYSLLILVPYMNSLVNFAVKLAAAVTIVMIAFGIRSAARLAINSIVFLAVNFVFAGVIYAVYVWLKPDFMHFNNSYFYIDFSLVILVCTTALLYVAVCIFRYFFDRIPENSGCYKVIIRYKDKIISLSGLADTGNSLVDFFSGKPVIICGKDRISDVIDCRAYDSENSRIPKGFRLIPCSTVSDSGVIPVFKPDEVIIFDLKNGMKKSVEALIGFGSGSTEAIFNPKLLKY